MDGPRWAALLAAAGAAAMAAPAAHAEVQAYRFHAEALGTSLDILAVAADPATALIAAQAARGEIDRLDAVLSGWRPDSELSALNGAETMRVSPDLYRVLAACERWRGITGGAFDARLGRTLALWREAEATGSAPDPDALDAARAALVDIGLDAATRTVTRPQAVVFAPEALAKGYVVDAALAAARAAAPGLAGMMVDIGGDLRCWGDSARDGGWTVGIAEPHAADNDAPALRLDASGRAVATSGPGARDFRIDGAAHPHLLGGRAGSATVVAPTAADADALATALAVMEPAAGLVLVDRLEGVEARVVDEAGGVHISGGWAGLTTPMGGALVRTAAAAPAATAAGPAWPARFRLTVDYQLPVIKELRVYSPYLAIWVTDENNRLIRAVTMLGDNLDYVGENYIWWRRYGRSRPELVAAVSRPTRRAGKYSIAWDGKDDAGRAVGQGRYTLHIEAIREDGGHSYQSIPLTLGAAPLQAGAPAEDELGATVVRYGPR